MKKLSAFIAILVIIVTTCSVRTQDKVLLKWKLEKGVKLQVKSEAETQSFTTTTTENGIQEKQNETEIQKVTGIMEVTEVLDNGNFKLTITTEGFEHETISKDQTMIISGKNVKGGSPEINVKIEGGDEILHSEDVKEMFRKITANVLEIKSILEVTPEGKVVNANIIGDLFENLPAETEVTRIMSKVIKKMISKEDLSSAIAAEVFVQVPSTGVDVKDSWPVKRSFSMIGLDMDGSGEATLQEINELNGVMVGKIEEVITYKLNTENFCEKFKEMIETIMEEAGVSVNVELNMFAKEDPVITSTSLFNIDEGMTMETIWVDQQIQFGGTLTMSIYGEKNNVEIDVLAKITSKQTIMRL